ncbi:MAG: NAD-dependent epimerase/dehydratase family protein [Acidobacteriia bacterium]|nr:NAD-dependent epimerase/dehydratase family protein [Terriglobia bacterium]
MGSHLAEGLLAAGYSVRVFDRANRDRRNLTSIAERIEIIEGDFSNKADLQAVVSGMDFVFHLVGTTLPASSNSNPVYDIESNVIGSVRLFELCQKEKVRKIVFASSGGTVYGIPQHLPIDESHPTLPLCSYGISKLAIEKYLHLFYHLHGMDYAILRIANPYGERQRLDASQGVIAVFLGCLAHHLPIHLWGDGSVTRDFLYVGDVARAMRLAMEYSGERKIFNVSSCRGVSVSDLLEVLLRVTGSSPEILREPERSFDVPKNILDNATIRRTLNWAPQVGLEEGIRCTWEWVKKQV